MNLSYAATTVLLCAVTLTGCGSDGSDDETPSRSTPSSATGAEAAERFETDVDDALEAVGEDGVTDALGQSLSRVLDGATGYEVADGRLYVDLEGSSSDDSSGCVIATSARDGVGLSTPISLRYADGTVDCD